MTISKSWLQWGVTKTLAHCRCHLGWNCYLNQSAPSQHSILFLQPTPILNQYDQLHGIWLVRRWKFATCKFSITCFKNYRARYSYVAPHVNKSLNWWNEKRSLTGGNFKVSRYVREKNVIRELIGIFESPKCDVNPQLLGVSGRWLAEPVVMAVALCTF